MITLGNVLSEDNIYLAIEEICSKKDRKNEDGKSELRELWDVNSEDIVEMVYKGIYEPKVVQQYEILKIDGRRRIISDYNLIDKLILRAIEQALRPEIEDMLHENCFAYRHGKGYVKAVQQAANYIEEGNIWVAEIDIAHYFDCIDLQRMMQLLAPLVDNRLHMLIEKYLYGKIEYEYHVRNNVVGLIQGSPLSPLLSNLFLNNFDWMIWSKYKHVRFSDNINIYTPTRDEALSIYNRSKDKLAGIGLDINKNKSGVFEAAKRIFLGYQFSVNTKKHKVTASRFKEKSHEVYKCWHKSAIQKIGKNYHLINDGILTRKDYNILFENESGKYIIPVEVVDSINIYSNVVFSSDFFKFANERRLRINFFDEFGENTGNYVASYGDSRAPVMLKQAEIYLDETKRHNLAKSMEIASVHNIRANLRYYKKHSKEDVFDEVITALSSTIKAMNETSTVKELLLLEARARQIYYSMFSVIVKNEDFIFEKRTRRPPKDPINALISFGNVFLYNKIATEIRKSSLDIRIGLIHATNRRSESLNLDIADIFKPVIVDRVIFTLINRKMIDAKMHFVYEKDESVYLNKEGKRLFIQELENKLKSSLTISEKVYTYDSLIREEVSKIYRAVMYDVKYKPYKYQ